MSSYQQMMKWNRKHPKGINYKKGYMGFHSTRGFTPAYAWLIENWLPYLEKCRLQGIEPMDQEQYYKSQLR